MRGFGQTVAVGAPCTPPPPISSFAFIGAGLLAGVLLPGYWKLLGLASVVIGGQGLQCIVPGQGIMTNGNGCQPYTQPNCIISM